MKVFEKIIILLLITFSVSAQSLSGVKICIDPGHGGRSSDDRFIAATGFWESESNWDKANYLKPMLDSLGAEVILTRKGDANSDDLGLSVRAGIANTNNVDFFHSIHSNGFQGTSNYTLMLYNGTDNSPTFAQAKTMGAIMMDDIYQAHRTTAKYNRGDNSFLGFNLGVLRPLTMPGTLSEGSFHDYVPESWRLLNAGYKMHEAKAIAKSFLEYFNGGTLTTGEIAGIVRDPLETVDYYFISSTNDSKKPINNLKVTLQPGDIVYDGDSKNNGFFYFENIVPGTYKLIYEAENFAKDSTEITVTANTTKFADKNMDLEPDFTPPTAISNYPLNGEERVSLSTKFIIDFDIRMDKSLTESAFATNPSLSGNFTWENLDKRLVYTPSSKLLPDTEYSYTIASAAKSFFGVNVSEPLSVTFKTRKKLTLVDTYPNNNEENVSNTVRIIFEFDAPIKQTSVFGNISFKDSENNSVSVSVITAAYAEGKIVFEPANPLLDYKTYTVQLTSGLADTDDLTLGEDFLLTFTTGKLLSNFGTVLDDLEANSGWQDPQFSGSTIGTDPEKTTFTLASTKKVNGNTSGFIKYAFTDSQGVCRLYRTPELTIGLSLTDDFGIWMFGDASGNNLQFWFRDNASANQIYDFGLIDWTGWKLLTIPMSEIGGSGEKKFHSIVINQIDTAKVEGQLYFDDLQIGTPVGVEDYENTSSPKKYELAQNYPNPFNPTTSIKYSVKNNEFVSLKIYDVLGNEIKTLVNETKEAGNYSVEFDASKISSGVYFYRINIGSFIQTKKMILLK